MLNGKDTITPLIVGLIKSRHSLNEWILSKAETDFRRKYKY